ncbi:MAG TPA: Sua5/YciO/YrdC/YwlC family protein, partial [Thermodesulfobacteriota bacterium]
MDIEKDNQDRVTSNEQQETSNEQPVTSNEQQGTSNQEPATGSVLIMACEVLKPDPQGIKKAAQIILQGGIIGFPTETFYGLAADALDEGALKKIFRV